MGIQLSASDLSQVLDSLKGSGSTLAGLEQRRVARMEVQAKVVVAPLVDGRLTGSFTALTRDISFRGIGLLQDLGLNPKQQFVVRLPRGNKDALLVLCTVSRCIPLADGIFAIGAEFSSVLARDSAEAMLKSGEAAVDRIRQTVLA